MSEFHPAKSSIAAIALLLASSMAYAASVETKGVTPCAFSAWSNDKDPAGLNVRAAPRADAPIIAKLPPPLEERTDFYAVEFSVIGSRDGWLLIQDAKFVDYDGDSADKPVFAGPGWVSGAKVGFEINDTGLRTGPDADAPLKAKLSGTNPEGGAYGPDSADVERVFACQGDFADVQLRVEKGPAMRGWVTRLCSNQVTTCV